MGAGFGGLTSVGGFTSRGGGAGAGLLAGGAGFFSLGGTGGGVGFASFGAGGGVTVLGCGLASLGSGWGSRAGGFVSLGSGRVSAGRTGCLPAAGGRSSTRGIGFGCARTGLSGSCLGTGFSTCCGSAGRGGACTAVGVLTVGRVGRGKSSFTVRGPVVTFAAAPPCAAARTSAVRRTSRCATKCWACLRSWTSWVFGTVWSLTPLRLTSRSGATTLMLLITWLTLVMLVVLLT